MERLDLNVEWLSCAWLDPTIGPAFDVAVDDPPESDVACLCPDAIATLWGFSGCLASSFCGKRVSCKKSPQLALSLEYASVTVI